MRMFPSGNSFFWTQVDCFARHLTPSFRLGGDEDEIKGHILLFQCLRWPCEHLGDRCVCARVSPGLLCWGGGVSCMNVRFLQKVLYLGDTCIFPFSEGLRAASPSLFHAR